MESREHIRTPSLPKSSIILWDRWQNPGSGGSRADDGGRFRYNGAQRGTNRTSSMRFRLTPRSMTLDDLQSPQGRMLLEFHGISQISETTTAKRMCVNPYCQGQRCNPLNLLIKIMFLALICRRFLGGFMHALLSRAYLSVSYGLSCNWKYNKRIFAVLYV